MFKTIENGTIPTKGSEFSACVDLYSRKDMTIEAGETVLIPLGVCIELNQLKEMNNDKFTTEEELNNWFNEFKHSHYLQLMLRSSLSKKLIIANGVGIIDIDYEDEIMIRVHNPFKQKSAKEDETVYIKNGDRVAQITILEHKVSLLGISSDEKRNGGFGSTGE